MDIPSSVLRRPLLAVFALVLAGCDSASPSEASDELDLTWLQEHAVPFTTTEPGGDYGDLAPFGQIVGDARVVGLGEATHGSREFFWMKHRILEYLVRERGFTVFGIEATHAEANRVNAYIHGGRGDPGVLLSNLYFWTWNTREVENMLRWMRAYNETAPEDRKLSFYGFDMQYSRVAMDDVVAYLRGVDGPAADSAVNHYGCYRRFQDRLYFGTPNYAATPEAIRQECRTGVQAAHTLLERRGGELAARSGRRAYDLALRAARVVVQNENTRANPQRGSALRDAYMAENIEWMGDVAEPGEKMVLWAHNAHVSRWEPFMGVHLADRYGDAYLVVGFSFHRGKFSAVLPGQGVWPTEAPAALASSYEHQFHRLGPPRFFVDLRPLRAGEPQAARWLKGPRLFRMIGAVYRPATPDDVYQHHALVSEYDVMIHVEETTATERLGFRYFEDP